jgi:hypothetical protein
METKEKKRVALYNLIQEKIKEYNQLMQPCKYEFYLSSLKRDTEMFSSLIDETYKKSIY